MPRCDVCLSHAISILVRSVSFAASIQPLCTFLEHCNTVNYAADRMRFSADRRLPLEFVRRVIPVDYVPLFGFSLDDRLTLVYLYANSDHFNPGLCTALAIHRHSNGDLVSQESRCSRCRTLKSKFRFFGRFGQFDLSVRKISIWILSFNRMKNLRLRLR